MATIFEKPDYYSFVGNLKNVVVGTTTAIRVQLFKNGVELFTMKYEAISSGKVSFSLKNIVADNIPFTLPGSESIIETDLSFFTLKIDNVDTFSFYALPGGIAASGTAQSFVPANFLSWQPQSKKTAWNIPSWLSYCCINDNCKLLVKAYFADKTTAEITLSSLKKHKCYIFNLTFSAISAKFQKQAICFDVSVVQNTTVLSFVQRYILSNDFGEYPDYFVFENSLGGIDTILFSGEKTLLSELEAKQAIFEDETLDYDLDFKKIYEKNTGYFPNYLLQTWVSEFFRSQNRFHFVSEVDSTLQRITISESDMKVVPNQPSSYSFNFAYAKQEYYLNLKRSEQLSDDLVFITPEEPVFLLAPRLSEYPLADVGADPLIPVQHPFENQWRYLPFSSFGSAGGNFIRKDIEDSALKKITFLGGIDVKKGIVSDKIGNETFRSGQFGSGFCTWLEANGKSYAEFDNLMVRGEMIVNTLTIAEIKSVGGQILVSLANTTFTKVEETASYYKCYFDNDDGKIVNQFAVDDQVICRKFNSSKIKYYWRRVLSIGVDYINLSKTDCDGSGIPDVGDEAIQFGNRTNTARQSAIMISAYGPDAPSFKQYAGVNSYNLTGKEVTCVSPSGNKFTGSFEVKTGNTSVRIPADRGTWNALTTYNYWDRVSFNGAYWLCIVPEGQTTIEKPSATSLFWKQDTTSQNDINNAIDNIQLGGRNLLRNSKWEHTSNVYGFANTNVDLDVDEYTFSANGRVDQQTLSDGKDLRIYAWQVGENNVWTWSTSLVINSLSDTTVSKTFTLPRKARVYVASYLAPSGGSRLGRVTLNWYKIEKGNKATDWSEAPEDTQARIDQAKTAAEKAQADASKAQASADTAKTNADTANKLLSDIANDDLLTPSEKQDTLKEWQIIQGEYPTLVAQANTYGVTSTDLTTKYNSLSTYITPLLSNLSVNSAISGITFRSTFKAYYDAKIALLKAVTDKAKTLADAAQKAADKAQADASNTQKEVEQFRSDYSSDFKILKDSIASKVSQTDFSSLQGRVSTTESKVEQQAGLITSTVEKVDKKNAVYKSYTSASTDRPSVPYAKSDIWITYDGRILQATTTRLSGAFIESDWKETVPSANDIVIGGRNLLRNSKWEHTSNVYGFATSSADVEAEEYSLSVNGHVDQQSLLDGKELRVYAWMVGDNNAWIWSTNIVITSLDDITLYKTFTLPKKGRIYVASYMFPNGGSRLGRVTTNWYKLEKGNKATDWSPAPEDVQDGLDKAKQSADNALTVADAKNRTFYSATPPPTPDFGFKVGDIWYKLDTVDGCNETYRWHGTGWVIINVNVSKSRIEQTDERITSTVEKTGIDKLGNGETLYSKINQTANEIKMEVDSIQIGTRNILLKSDEVITRSPLYLIKTYRTSIDLVAGQKYTFVIKGQIQGTQRFGLWMNGGTSHVGYVPATTDQVRYFTFTAVAPNSEANKRNINLYNFPGTGSATYPASVEWVALYEGDIKPPLDWTPATEDMPDRVGSSLSITGSAITLASKTIVLDGTTVSKAIETKSLDIGNGNFHVGTDGVISAKGANISGTINATNGSFSGTLKGVEGSFKKLQAVDANGTVKAEIGLSEADATFYFDGDMQHQGYNNAKNRGYRFLTSDLWCRNSFGTRASNVLYVVGSYGYYYTKGLENPDRVFVSLQSSTAQNGITYYMIPLYGVVGDASGFPVDMVIINTTTVCSYLLYGSLGKQITVINSNDKLSTFIFSMGNRLELVGGTVRSFFYIDGFFAPTITSNALGRGWIAGPAYDNSWS